MTRMQWDQNSDRYYEKGLDRGVFYNSKGEGVPWNGLVSVVEEVTSAEPKAIYVDGVKRALGVYRQDFYARLETLSTPKEFLECEGVSSIAHGLFATAQGQKFFSLSYRTNVINAFDSGDENYNIHLIYNAVAIPESRVQTTQTDSAGISTRTWTIHAVPPASTQASYFPSAHLIIEKKLIDPAIFAEVEDYLYGSEWLDSRIPHPDILIRMLQQR